MKKKTMIITISVIAVVALIAVAVVATREKAQTPQPIPEATPNTTDAVELIDEKTDFEVEEVKEETSAEKANAGSDDVGLETPEDAEYENQLRAEEGMEKTYITMYALKDADVKKEMNETSETVTTVKKGQEVQVAGTENGWLDVKVNTNMGYMEEGLLVKTLEETKETQTVTTPTAPAETPLPPQTEMEVVQTPETPVTPPTPTPAPQPTPPVAGVTPEEQALIDAGIISFGGEFGTVPSDTYGVEVSEEKTREHYAELGIDYDSVKVY